MRPFAVSHVRVWGDTQLPGQALRQGPGALLGVDSATIASWDQGKATEAWKQESNSNLCSASRTPCLYLRSGSSGKFVRSFPGECKKAITDWPLLLENDFEHTNLTAIHAKRVKMTPIGPYLTQFLPRIKFRKPSKPLPKHAHLARDA